MSVLQHSCLYYGSIAIDNCSGLKDGSLSDGTSSLTISIFFKTALRHCLHRILCSLLLLIIWRTWSPKILTLRHLWDFRIHFYSSEMFKNWQVDQNFENLAPRISKRQTSGIYFINWVIYSIFIYNYVKNHSAIITINMYIFIWSFFIHKSNLCPFRVNKLTYLYLLTSDPHRIT